MTRNEIWLIKIPEHKAGDAFRDSWRKVHAYLDYKRDVLNISLQHKFPRSPSKKIYMNIKLYHADKKHGDGDNYWKAIADAIFTQDKYVAGSFDFFYADVPRVEVEIIIPEGVEDVIKKPKPIKEMTYEEAYDKAL